MIKLCVVCDGSLFVRRVRTRRSGVLGRSFSRLVSDEGVLFSNRWFCNSCWDIIMGDPV